MSNGLYLQSKSISELRRVGISSWLCNVRINTIRVGMSGGYSMHYLVLFRHRIFRRKCDSMNDQILTVKQVADYLKVNERTVYRMATAGKLPAFKVGASWRFKQDEIEGWIKAQHNQDGK